MKKRMRLPLEVLFVVVVGVLHWFVAGYLIFMGTIIDPQAQHVATATIGFVMLLPFSALIFVPALQSFDLLLGVLGGLLWGWYYLLILKWLGSKLAMTRWCSGLCSRE